MSEKPNTPQPSTPSDSPDLAQMERVLKEQLNQADKNPRDVLWQLARLGFAGRPKARSEPPNRSLLSGSFRLVLMIVCISS